MSKLVEPLEFLHKCRGVRVYILVCIISIDLNPLHALTILIPGISILWIHVKPMRNCQSKFGVRCEDDMPVSA